MEITGDYWRLRKITADYWRLLESKNKSRYYWERGKTDITTDQIQYCNHEKL